MSTKSDTKPSGKKASNQGGRPIVKKEKVPIKYDVSKELEVELLPGKAALTGAISVFITDGKVSRQLTIHHPIGITPDLDEADWVSTLAGEIPTLLSHTVDPDGERIRSARSKLRNELATKTTPPVLKLVGTSYEYPCGGNRDELIKKARELADLQLEKDLKVWQQTAASKDPNAKDKPKRANPLVYLDKTYQDAEKEVQNFFEFHTTKAELDKKYPFTFKTRSGQLLDKDQVRINDVGKRITSAQVFDSLVYRVSKLKLKTVEEIKTIEALAAGT
jgi:hypothetical protein